MAEFHDRILHLLYFISLSLSFSSFLFSFSFFLLISSQL